MTQRRGKYNARAVYIGALRFDSLAEAARYRELTLLEAAGAITGLEIHPRFELQPAFTDGDGRRWTAITYEGDFSYTEAGAHCLQAAR